MNLFGIGTAISIAFAWAIGGAFAQQSPNKIGILINGSPSPLFESIKSNIVADFAKLGYDGDRQVVVEPRFADQKLDRLPRLAEELVAANVDLIFALGGPAAVASQKATSTVPIVFAIVTDPVALKLVSSMEQPGANVTGVTSLDPHQAREQFKLLREAFPGIKRVAIISDKTIPGADQEGLAPIDRANEAAARDAGFEPLLAKVKDASDLEAAFAELVQNGAQAALVLEVPVPFSARKQVAELARKHGLPTMFPGGQADANGVVTYGTSVADAWRLMPLVADKILRGVPARDVPVHLVTKRELVINLQTARAVGVTLPEALLKRADRVVE
jgi:putative ABC transport system substrate-binding protein